MHENKRISARRGWIGEKNDFFSALLYTRIPLVPLIVLPIPTFPADGAGQGLDQFDHHSPGALGT